MTKVSAPTFVVCGLGDPKVSPSKDGVADGLLVNIPVLGMDRYYLGRDDDGYSIGRCEFYFQALKQSR